MKRSDRRTCPVTVERLLSRRSHGSKAMHDMASPAAANSNPPANTTANPGEEPSASTAAPAAGGTATAPSIDHDSRLPRNTGRRPSGTTAAIQARISGRYRAWQVETTPVNASSHQTAPAGRAIITITIATRAAIRTTCSPMMTGRRQPPVIRTRYGASTTSSRPKLPTEPNSPICIVVAPSQSAAPVWIAPTLA